jgi:hypothetical protein
MADDQRENRARDWIAALSGIPTRFAGSYSERVSAERVGEWMRELGLSEVGFEPVASRPRTGWALALHAGVALLGFWCGGFLGVLLTAVVAWSRFLPSPESVNVVGRGGTIGSARRVILSAHIDAPQAGWIFSPQLADLFARRSRGRQTLQKPPPGPLSVQRAVFLTAAAIALVEWMGAHGFWFGIIRLAAMALLLLTVVLTLQWANAMASPGANDNASAVASMLTCAEAMLAAHGNDVELWVVGTGAEEVGCCGMHGFVKSHSQWERDSTFYVNFECTGGGALHYIRTEGLLHKFSYPPTLLEVARTQARGAFEEITPTDLMAATDGHVPAEHGYPTLSMISLESNGVPRNYHRPEDTVEAIDLAMVVRAADFGAAVASAALRGEGRREPAESVGAARHELYGDALVVNSR